MSRVPRPQDVPGKRYQQVAESLLGDMRAGRLAVGDSLPGELELVESFGVSRHTVREALRRLEELGLIGRRQGVGTVVLAREPTRSYVQSVPTPAALLQYPEGNKLVLRSSEPVRATRVLARLIGCKTGAQWQRVSCLRQFADERPPICWVDIYLLPEHESIVQSIGRRPGLVHELIEQGFGEQVAAVDISIMARAVPARMSDALRVEAGTPSLTVVRRYRGARRRLFMASVSEHPGDRFTYALSLERGWQSGGSAVWSSR
jgi:GntR family transcriptional regulator